MAISRLVEHEGFNPGYVLSHEINVGKFHYEYTYVGCVLGLGEYNGYDDSDFYAMVWDEENQTVKKVWYDTTRAYTNTTAHVDATDEVREKARRFYESERRSNLAKNLNELRLKEHKVVHKHELSIVKLREMSKTHSKETYEDMLCFLSKNVRSNFKKSLRDQIVGWIKSDERKYDSPLSKKQWQYIY